MGVFAPLLSRVEGSALAAAIAQSTLVTGLLSGVHLIGLTLVVGAVLLSSLRLLGVILPEARVADVTGAARRAIQAGLAISVVTGLLLLAPRVSQTIGNSIFQIKMLLLLAAAAFHFTIYRGVLQGKTGDTPDDAPASGRFGAGGTLADGTLAAAAAGALGLILWCGVALAGCAFILIE